MGLACETHNKSKQQGPTAGTHYRAPLFKACMYMKLEQARKIIKELNYRFHDLELSPDGIYRELEKLGVDIQRSILIEIFPDSGDTYVGRIINQDSNLLAFDVDCSDSKFSAVVQIPFPKLKPWDILSVGVELHEDLYS